MLSARLPSSRLPRVWSPPWLLLPEAPRGPTFSCHCRPAPGCSDVLGLTQYWALQGLGERQRVVQPGWAWAPPVLCPRGPPSTMLRWPRALGEMALCK